MNDDDEEQLKIRTCGRETRSGNPCRNRLNYRDVACATHITEQERQLEAAYQQGWRDGSESGRKSAESSHHLQVERLERRIRELENSLDEATRVYEIGGDQVVEIGKYSYRWRGHPRLNVGDRVLLPENWLSGVKHGRGNFEDVVTRLGSTYRGDLSYVVGRIPPD